MKDLEFETAMRRIARLTKYIEQQRKDLITRTAQGKETNEEKATLQVMEEALANLVRNSLLEREQIESDMAELAAQQGSDKRRTVRRNVTVEANPFCSLRKERATFPRHAGQPTPAEATERKQEIDSKVTMIDQLRRARLASRP